MNRIESQLELARECGLKFGVIRNGMIPINGYAQDLIAYTSRILADKEAEIAKLETALEAAQHNHMIELHEANARMARMEEQVARLRSSLEHIACIWDEEYPENIEEEVKETLSSTQATDDAFMRKERAKVLEEAADIVFLTSEESSCKRASEKLLAKAEEIRAANKE